MTSSSVLESRFPVGSSARIIAGELTKALAMELVNDGELKDAMTETHKRIQKDSEYKEEYLDDVEGIEYEIKDVKVDGKEAEVEIELTDDDDSRTMHLKLKKIDGDWLIVGGRV